MLFLLRISFDLGDIKCGGMQGIQLFRCVATFRRHSNKKEEDDEVRCPRFVWWPANQVLCEDTRTKQEPIGTSSSAGAAPISFFQIMHTNYVLHVMIVGSVTKSR
jgi:hypothetical protein